MFQNSGAEATEAAIKVARRYFYSIGKPKKIEYCVLKIHFMEEHWQLYMQVVQKK